MQLRLTGAPNICLDN